MAPNALANGPMPTDPLSSHLQDILADALEGAVEQAVAQALVAALPEVLRRSALPVYLTREGVTELTGWSARKLSYLQAQRRLPYIKRGRTVLFRTTDVEAYLGEGYVSARGP